MSGSTLRPRPAAPLCGSRLVVGAFLLTVAGYAAFISLTELSGGVLKHYSVAGAYHLKWSGAPVVYAFFAKLVYFGLALALFTLLERQTLVRWTLVAAAAATPLANVFLLGRRNEAVLIALTVLVVLYFRRAWTPPRHLLILAFLLGAAFVILAPDYRRYSLIGADRSDILTIEVPENIGSILTGRARSELEYSAVQLAATWRAGEYNFGIGFYNRFIQEWLPKRFVGDAAKKSMLIDGPNFLKHTLYTYGWAPRPGWVPTAVVDTFRELGPFGPLLLFVVGRGYRWLWEYAQYSPTAQLLYVASAPFSMLMVVSGVTPLPSWLAYAALFLLPVLLWARLPDAQADAPGAARNPVDPEQRRIVHARKPG